MSNKEPTLDELIPRGPWWLESLVVALAYFAAARVGQLVAVPPGNVTAVWPPSGLAVAAVLLRGNRVLPGICVAGMAANIWPYFFSSSWPSHALTGIVIGAAIAAQAWIGAWLAHRWAGGSWPFIRVADMLRFLIFAGCAACLVGSTVGTTCLAVVDLIPKDAFADTWLTWYLGDTTGVMLFAPFVLAWSRRFRRRRRRISWLGPYLESTFYTAVLLTVFVTVFWQEACFGTNYPLMHCLLPSLAWAAFRFEPHGATLSLVTVTSLAVVSTTYGHGPFVQGSPNVSLLLMDSFFVVVSSVVLLVVAATSERQRAAQSLDALSDQLIHASRVTTLGEMAASLAHELSQPLGAVANNAKAALRGLRHGSLETAEIDEALGAISDETQRAVSVIRSLRSLAEKSAPQRVPTDLPKLLREIVDLYTRGTDGSADIHVRIDTTTPPLLVEPVQLQQAILNLLQNAHDAMRGLPARQREILLTSTQREGAVEILVTDHGVGLSAEQAEHCFDAFHTTKQSGLGMGLKIARLIVESHGGRVWLTPNSTTGVTAHLILPIDPMAPCKR